MKLIKTVGKSKKMAISNEVLQTDKWDCKKMIKTAGFLMGPFSKIGNCY